MAKKNSKFPCGSCLSNVSKNTKAVLCKVCMRWFHFKCIDLSVEEFTKIGKNTLKWACASCLSNDLSEGEEEVAEAVHGDAVQEINSLNELIKTLNEDLTSANNEIQNLKRHTVQLESMVLKKQETIEIMERQLNSNVNRKNVPSIAKTSSRYDKRLSMPTTFNTPTSRSSMNPGSRGWSSEKIGIETFANVTRKKKTSKNTSLPQANVNETNSLKVQNRYEVLLDEVSDISDKNETLNKILICSDSHGRGLAWELNQNKVRTHEAVSFVKPGGRAKQVLNCHNIDGERLDKDDVLVIICGTNDVAVNEAEDAVSNIKATLDKVKNTQVVLVDIPNRYDLAEWSCVNKEVRKTNLQLKQLSEDYKVPLVEVSKADRKLHTRHGMHLNSTGKTWLADQILKKVINFNHETGTDEHCLSSCEGEPAPPGTLTPSENSQFPSPNHNP